MSIGLLDCYSISVCWEVAFETLMWVISCPIIHFESHLQRERALCQFAYTSFAMRTQLGAGHGSILDISLLSSRTLDSWLV